MRAARRVGRQHAQAAGHAEVQDQGGAGVEREQQVLRPSRRTLDAGAGDARGQVGGDGPAQPRFVHLQRHDLLARDVGLDAAPGGLDFGKLRHAGLT